jgi:hypothetical protein
MLRRSQAKQNGRERAQRLSDATRLLHSCLILKNFFAQDRRESKSAVGSIFIRFSNTTIKI